MESNNPPPSRDSGLPKGIPMVGMIIIALLIAFLAFILLAMLVYGARKICPCFCIPKCIPVPQPHDGRSWSDLQPARGQDMRQPSNAPVDSITLVTTGLRAPPPAYPYPFTCPPEYQSPFFAAGNIERGNINM